MESAVEHCGIIERVEGDRVFVRIAQQSACSTCRTQSTCMAATPKDRLIEVTDRSGLFKVHDAVKLCGQSGMAGRAVALAFLIPLALVVTAIIIGSRYGNDSIGAFAGLAALIPYYAALYLLKKRLDKRFAFTLKKITP